MAKPSQSDQLVFFCNGVKISDQNPDPTMSLAKYLRSNLQMYGCKIGCNTGGCGSCTVMLSSVMSSCQTSISHIAVNACLYPLGAIHGKAVTTVEGIGSAKTKLHPVQERLAKSHGSQCGFCSPGMVMSMYTLLRNNPKPTSEEILQAVEGNLCRCTGYRPILDAFNTFTEGGCCQGNGGTICCKTNDNEMCSELFDVGGFKEYDPTQDIIFPPELLLNTSSPQTAVFTTDQVTWINAISLEDICCRKTEYPGAVIVAGNTQFDSVSHKGVIIYAGQVAEFNSVTLTDSGLKVGAYVTMSQLLNAVTGYSSTLPCEKSSTLLAIQETLQRYGSHQIRNVSTIGGHIVSAKAGYDLIPVLLAVNAKLEIINAKGSHREILMDDKLYHHSIMENGLITKKACVILASDEVLQSVEIPFTSDNEYVGSYKMTGKRNHVDEAIVSAAFRVMFEPGTDIVRSASLVFGSLQNIPSYANVTAKTLCARVWNTELLEYMCVALKEELAPQISDQDAIADYQKSLIAASFFKFFINVQQSLQEKQMVSSCSTPIVSDGVQSASEKLPHGTTVFQPVPDDQPSIDPIGRPIVHRSALQQTTGEAVYVDDIPPVQGETYLGLVLPSLGRAKIVFVDATEALALEGVVTYVCANDVPGVNSSLSDEEEFFVTEQVYSVSQIIGAIVATTPKIAHEGAKLVQVTYEELPVITTIEEAIENNAFHKPADALETIHKGDVEKAFIVAQSADESVTIAVTEGALHMAAQEHFYMESTACVAVPTEVDEMDIRCNFQDISPIQYSVAKALGVDANKINCRTKRVGGSFGGKSNRCIYMAACAVAAKKTGKTVRMVLTREEDMQITGNREGALAKYKVSYDIKTGKILAVEITVYFNWGMPGDIHQGLCGQLLFSIDNVYSINDIRVTVKNCATNTPASKPLRTFGIVQSLFIIESIITDVAVRCNIPEFQVREVNMHQDECPTTFCGVIVDDFGVFKRCWKECVEKSDYHARRRQIDEYNSKNRWTKHGLALVPMRFNVGCYPVFLHQAAAMVNVYTDGSILIHIGGIEVGQGLHTKMIQIASRVLGITVDKIHVAENSTYVIHNATDTAASNSTDMWGMAVKNACETIADRLSTFKDSNPDGSFSDWASAAYFARVNLSAIGYHKTPGIDWDWSTLTGRPYPYSTYGVACSEVKIDCLTGQQQLMRTDIVMDVGKSLNPALDIGQIEGAFMMGYGFFVLEELLWAKDGSLITNGPQNYRIPCVRDIPKEFNVTLLRNCPNPKGVYSSKGIGEPSLCLASSVHLAIQDAIRSARADAAQFDRFELDTPATADRIRKACGEVLKFTK